MREDNGQTDRTTAIRNGIVAAILEHRVQPGTKLGEDELGSIYGASRTIVRAALQALAHEGIVVIEKNRGAFIARPGPAEAREVFEARTLIEPAIAARAASRAADPAVIAEWAPRLRAHLDEERAALARGDDRAAIRLSGEYHMLIARMAAHSIYEAILGELIARSSLIILLYKSRRAHFCGTDHHAVLADAILAGDGPGAGRLMVEHLVEIEHGLDLGEPAALGASLSEALRG
ncbi:MAG: GntR family transcriptional regulator [Hyphomicrobiaceae bacterium]|nr:GntR family transcriptional regulator [Hyphomicrobiaceae bacterium]